MFEGFSADDFDAYLEEKWSSNMFTLERRKVKEKLAEAGARLDEVFSGIDLGLVSYLSDDYPSLWNRKKVSCQWLFFSRDLGARKELEDIIDREKSLAETLEDPTPLYRHIFLGISVNLEHLEIGIRLHHDAWVDRDNFLALIHQKEARKSFMNQLFGLGEGFVLGLTEGEYREVSNLTEEGLVEFVNRFKEGGRWVFLGRTVSREEAIAAGSGVYDIIRGTIESLVPVYRFMAWSAQNDAVSMENLIQKREMERQATHEEMEEERRIREKQHRETVERRQQAKEARRQDLLEEQAWQQKQKAIKRAAASKRSQAEAAFAALAKQAPEEKRDLNSAISDDAGHPGTESGDDSDSIKNRSSAKADIPSSGTKGSKKGKLFEKSPKLHKERRGSGKRRQAKGGSFKSSSRKKAPSVSKERMADVQVGDRVLVKQGFLKDRTGVVQSVLEKGELKVSFGMLSSRIAKKDVKGLGPDV